MKKIFFIALLGPVLAVAQSQDQNYVRTRTYKQASSTSIPNPSPEQASTSITYLDGLGRPIQQVAVGQSASGKSIIVPVEYDAFGRQAKEYLPYASQGSGQDYVPGALAEVLSYPYYQGQPPYSEKLFESSPLNRVLKQSAPGSAWALGTGREIKTDYQAVNTAIDHLVRYAAVATWDAAQQIYNVSLTQGSYSTGDLYKTVTKDENWVSGHNGTTEEFKDKEGRVVLKRTYADSQPHDTYDVYDQFGNLSYVLPPMVANAQSDLDGLCYQYKYDYRNRLAEKKLPGKQWEFIIYDKLDRVIATGPALSPFDGIATGWLVTKYDDFDRVAYTGWYVSKPATATRAVLQAQRNASASSFSEKRVPSGSVDNISIGYSSSAFPTSEMKLLTVNYYDDYSYPEGPTSFGDVEGQPVFYNLTAKPKGMPTGSWVRVLDGSLPSSYELSYSLYDAKGRAIRNHTKNYLGGYTTIDSKLDFQGKALYTVTRHARDAQSAELYLKDTYAYTEQDRLLSHVHQIGENGTPELLAMNEYDELGQLVAKKVGGNDLSGSLPLQKVDYQYNIRGWLTAINEMETLNESGQPDDLFAFAINYNTVANSVNGAVKPLYNGNISETFWVTSSDKVQRSYSYAYDALNRLNESFYHQSGLHTGAYDEYHINYDKNGNIQQLSRNGGIDPQNWNNMIDDLYYSYNPQNKNQLISVLDDSGNPEGFSDGANTGEDYAYDDYGNMVSDANKRITSISYNHLNLPISIVFPPSGTIKRNIYYLYDALGTKKKKAYSYVGRGVSRTDTVDYLGGFQYKNGLLQFFPTSEGYAKAPQLGDLPVFSYIYNYTDHLGNVRLSYGDTDRNGIISPVDEIVEENNYYAFGMKHEGYNYNLADGIYKYKYNGKEFQDELGLNLYDYGARNYDPAIGRWMNIDPLAEVSRRFSPYTYALNNPVYFIDPDGMMAIGNDDNDDVITKVSNTKRSGKNVQRDISITVTLSIVAGKNDDLSKTQFNKKSGSIRLTNFEGNAQFYLEGAELMSNDNVTSVNVNYKVVNSLDDVGQDDHVMMLVDAIPKDFGKALDPQGKAEVGGRVSAVERRTLGDGTFNQVSQHELGHNLGMNHSPDGTGLMGATVNGSTTSKVRRGEMVNNELVMTSGNGTYKQSSRNTTYKTPIKNQANNFIKQNRIKK